MISSQLFKERGRWIRLAPWINLLNRPNKANEIVIDIINRTLSDKFHADVGDGLYNCVKVLYYRSRQQYHIYFQPPEISSGNLDRRIIVIPAKSAIKQLAWEASVPTCIDFVVNQHRLFDYSIVQT